MTAEEFFIKTGFDPVDEFEQVQNMDYNGLFELMEDFARQQATQFWLYMASNTRNLIEQAEKNYDLWESQ